jgi:hypothetical protein
MDAPGDQPRRHQVGFAALMISDSGINRLRFSSCEDLLKSAPNLSWRDTGRRHARGQRLPLGLGRQRHRRRGYRLIARRGGDLRARSGGVRGVLPRVRLEPERCGPWLHTGSLQLGGRVRRHRVSGRRARRTFPRVCTEVLVSGRSSSQTAAQWGDPDRRAHWSVSWQCFFRMQHTRAAKPSSMARP